MRSRRGLSRARNAALPSLSADVVAFPDDDCLYAPDLLARVAERFAADPGLDGLGGRPVAADGRTAGRWPSRAQRIRPETVFHTAISHTIFLRLSVVEPRGRLRRAARARVGHALELGRGDRLPRPRPPRGAHRVRPVARGHASGQDAVARRARRARAAGRRKSRLRARGQPLSRGRRSCGCSCGRSSRRSPSPSCWTAPARGSSSRRSAAASAGWSRDARAADGYPTSAAKSSAWRSSQSESAKRSTARARAPAKTVAVGEHRGDGRGERLRRRWLVPLESVGMRDADAGNVADELDRAAARRVRDRDAARHRLDHGGRAGVVHLRVEQDVCPAEDVGRLALRVPPGELHGGAEPEPRDRRAGVGDEPAADEEPRAGMGVQHVPERLERELETVLLRLVAAEQHDRPVRRHRPRGEAVHVDGVREDLPRAVGHAEERVGGALAEQRSGRATWSAPWSARRSGTFSSSVLLAGPARVGDAVLVDDDLRPTPPRDPEELSEVARQVRRPEVQEREVRRRVRPARGELLELRGAAGDRLARCGDQVPAVEDAEPRPARPPVRSRAQRDAARP